MSMAPNHLNQCFTPFPPGLFWRVELVCVLHFLNNTLVPLKFETKGDKLQFDSQGTSKILSALCSFSM